MASKVCYIYRIEMGHNGFIERSEYCYARNKDCALKFYKEKFRDKKYNTFKAVAFGTANMKRHPHPFEELEEDEVEYLKAKGYGMGDVYSRVVTGGTFIPVKREETT